MGRSPWDTLEPPSYEQLMRWESMYLADISRVMAEQQAYLSEAGGKSDDKTYIELQQNIDESQSHLEELYKLIHKHYRDVPRPEFPTTGESRSVTISLTAQEWVRIDAAIASRSAGSLAEYFQDLYRKS
jgi:hypothetical protein